MKLMKPFSTTLDLQTGTLTPVGQVSQRHLSDMRGMYTDRDAVRQILEQEGDRLIYEVHGVDLPEKEGFVLYSTTIIQPGRVGAEYHMTKGHFHARRDRSEIYVGLVGKGYLLLQTEDGRVEGVPMCPGTVAYVPPMWAHRTVNTGEELFSFLAAWRGDAGHDYGTIEETGFAKLLVDQGGKPTFVDNPKLAR